MRKSSPKTIALSLLLAAAPAAPGYAAGPALKDPNVTVSDAGSVAKITIAPAQGDPIEYRIDLSRHHAPATSKDDPCAARWAAYRFGAFVCYNTNQFSGDEFCSARDPRIYNPQRLDVTGWAEAFRKAGMKYAVLTTRHTSGFLLWDSPTTFHCVRNSGDKTDVVRAFTDECREQGITPCIYYCMWGKTYRKEQANPRAVILAQLYELATRYGRIGMFWIDIMNGAPSNLPAQEVYDLLKTLQPGTFVLMNQHVQDGRRIAHFPTDGLNGEVCLPPKEGHDPWREVKGQKYYLPFEFEPVSQARARQSLCDTPMGRGVWFTYGQGKAFAPSTPFPADKLARWCQDAYDRGATNVLLSCAPDYTGALRPEDAKQLEEVGKLLATKDRTTRPAGEAAK